MSVEDVGEGKMKFSFLVSMFLSGLSFGISIALIALKLSGKI